MAISNASPTWNFCTSPRQCREPLGFAFGTVHMRRFQAGQDRIERELKEIKGRLCQVEISVAGVRGDIAQRAGRQARQPVTSET